MSDPFWDDVADQIIAEPDEDKRKALIDSYPENTRHSLRAVIQVRVNRHISLLEKLQAGEGQGT